MGRIRAVVFYLLAWMHHCHHDVRNACLCGTIYWCARVGRWLWKDNRHDRTFAVLINFLCCALWLLVMCLLFWVR